MSRHLNSLKNGIRGIEDEIIRIKTDMHNQQMRQQEAQFNQRAIKERLLQAYKIEWDTIVLWMPREFLFPWQLNRPAPRREPQVNIEELNLRDRKT